MLPAIYESIQSHYQGDATLPGLLTGGFYLGQPPEGAVAPYASIRQAKGGRIDAHTGRTSVERYRFRVVAVAPSFASASAIAEAFADRFDRAALPIVGPAFVGCERLEPPFVDEDEPGRWSATLEYEIGLNRVRP